MSLLHSQAVKLPSRLELIAKQVVEGFITGMHKSPFHGFSVEFAEHRIYNKGESTKHIDWKLFGRTGKLFVKRYEEETNLRCQIVIDASSSMLFPMQENTFLQKLSITNKSIAEEKTSVNKLDFSVYCAATLMEMLKRQRDAVGLSVFSDSVDFNVPPKISSLHHQVVLNELDTLLKSHHEAPKKTFAVEALHQIAQITHKRSLVVIFSDMMDSRLNSDGSSASEDELFAALQHLKHKQHEVVLFHVVDKQKEVDFDFENRPYRFVDMESNAEIKLHPNEIKEAYVTSIANYHKALKLKCHQYKIDFVEADISQSFDQVLTAYLLKRKSML